MQMGDASVSAICSVFVCVLSVLLSVFYPGQFIDREVGGLNKRGRFQIMPHILHAFFEYNVSMFQCLTGSIGSDGYLFKCWISVSCALFEAGTRCSLIDDAFTSSGSSRKH